MKRCVNSIDLMVQIMGYLIVRLQKELGQSFTSKVLVRDTVVPRHTPLTDLNSFVRASQ